MKGSAENRASDAPDQDGRREVVLNLGTARRMLPLVARIVSDVVGLVRQRQQLAVEKECLDSQRHRLAWPQRQRRYQVQEEGVEVERQLSQARGELEQLGVALIEPQEGRVGLPTVVNGHLAFFSWKPVTMVCVTGTSPAKRLAARFRRPGRTRGTFVCSAKAETAATYDNPTKS